ncbi:MAG TPA: efflux transporter outer membrane subunit [Acetobacteraceae bacterium]|nr:efflux transporter outer membrane subunit [Acetobacteraceae bacterium]
MILLLEGSMLALSKQSLRSAPMASNLAQTTTRPVHREWCGDGRQHLPASTMDGGLDNEALHGRMAAILAESRPGYRILFVSVLISMALAGCAVGPDFVAPAPPRAPNYVIGQAAIVTAPASGDTAQQIHLGGGLEADWWTRLRSPELDRTVTLALSSNRTLEVARANILQASEEIKVARAGLLPQVDATGGLARQQYGASFLGPEAATFPTFSAYSAGIGISYDVDAFGRTRRGIELAAADKDVQQEMLRAAQLGIASDTVLEALLIASTRAQVDVVNSVIASDQRTVDLVQSRLAQGAASEQDVTTAQSQLDRDRTLLPALRQQLNTAEDALATLVGRSPAEWSAPDFSLAGMSLPQDVPLVVPSDLVRSRPDIRAAEAQLHAASAAVGIATADLYPRINLSANVAEQGLLGGPAGAAWGLIGGITAPIFHGGALTAQRRAAQDAYQAVFAQYQQTVLIAFRQIADTLHALQNGADAVTAQHQALTSATKALGLSRDAYIAGNTTILQVLDAQRLQQLAELSLVQARTERFIQTVNLFVAAGGGLTASGAAE